MDNRHSSHMRKRYERNLKIDEALWSYINDRPYLILLYGLDALYIAPTISKNLLSLGLVYLGEEWKNKVPPIQIMGLEVQGFVKDVTLNLLVKHFIAAVEENYFVERTIDIPNFP